MKEFLRTINRCLLQIKRMYLLNRTIVRWREKNRHNYTIPANAQFPNNQVSVGNYTYGPLYVIPYRDDVFLKIGSCCSIAEDVVSILGENII